MKITPTRGGGLRIDAEEPGDWLLLKGIAHDAVSGDEKPARRLGQLITDEEVAADWRDYVMPDLEAGFVADVLHVTTAIAAARFEAGDGPGPLWITREDAFPWYGTLNQARLALEERFHFGGHESVDPADLLPVPRAAFLRSHLYCAIQSLLLEHAL
ncbi:MAG: hypothetical protein WCJ14_03615 [Verrucomicrobiota bacterium]